MKSEPGTVGKRRKKVRIAAAELPGTKQAAPKPAITGLKALVCALLVAVTLVAYWQVFRSQFTYYDDNVYITQNPYVQQGLNWSTIKWAFTTFHSANWHPLTWLSHLTDVTSYGMNPGRHHATSLLFHLLNTLLLFLVFSRMTGSIWRSGFIAALFAIHPLHVESVAWVAERKDVLCTFFSLIAMYAYVLHTERPERRWFIVVVISFVLALMSKPMAVSLPVMLLLIDYWPLRRTEPFWPLVREKASLFALALASSVITIIAQHSGGAVATLSGVPFGVRLGNAAMSYVLYGLKMMWPQGLSVFYPFSRLAPPLWQPAGAAVLLSVLTILTLRMGRRRPYLAVGWLWYLITLVPVIGLLQVGSQAMADRYTYVTLIGLFVIIAWGVPELISRRSGGLRGAVSASAVVVILALSACTWSQVGVWRDTYTLFNHALQVTDGNSIAYNDRGAVFLVQKKLDKAIADFQKAVELDPNFGEAHGNLGTAFVQVGRNDEGIEHGLTAISLGYDTPGLRYHIALGYTGLNKPELAIKECDKVLRKAPAWAAPHNLLGMLFGATGKLDKAILHLQIAAELEPSAAEPHGNLAMAYYSKKDYKSAWRETHIFTKMGGQPRPKFLEMLSSKMPDPGQ